jgi:hypothetical protein
MRSWSILFAVLGVVAGCAGKSQSDDDDSGGSPNDAGQGGAAATGAGQGGSGTAARGGSAGRGGTGSGTGGGTGGALNAGATGGTLSSGGLPSTGGTLSSGATGGGGTAGIGAAGEAASGGTGGSVEPVCTALSAQAPAAQFAYGGAGIPPAPEGGAILSGTYYLALETFYGAAVECEEAADQVNALGYQISEVVRFTAADATTGTMEVVAQVSVTGTSAPSVTGTGIYSTSGTALSLTATCGEGNGSSTPIEFTATDDQIVLFTNADTVCTPTIAVFQRL